ncbi:hypothetical protein TNCT_600911, partial [Trichonephila clavata]
MPQYRECSSAELASTFCRLSFVKTFDHGLLRYSITTVPWPDKGVDWSAGFVK